MLTLLFFPGNPSASQGTTKGAPIKVPVPIILGGGIVTGVVASAALLYVGCLTCMDDGEHKGAKAAEWAAVQSAIDLFMTDNALREVAPSTSGAGGEKINGTGTQFHGTLELHPYIRAAATTYCYQWQSGGRIISQYDVNDDGTCAIDAD